VVWIQYKFKILISANFGAHEDLEFFVDPHISQHCPVERLIDYRMLHPFLNCSYGCARFAFTNHAYHFKWRVRTTRCRCFDREARRYVALLTSSARQ
jgi:hypothetical protein